MGIYFFVCCLLLGKKEQGHLHKTPFPVFLVEKLFFVFCVHLSVDYFAHEGLGEYRVYHTVLHTLYPRSCRLSLGVCRIILFLFPLSLSGL